MSEKGNRAYNSRKGGEGGSGKGFYCDIDLDGSPLSGHKWNSVWHEWNHFKPCFCGSSCLQLWSFEVPVGLTALEIAVAAEFMKARLA